MDNPLSEEVRKSVANCIQNGGILRVGSVAQRLADVHPDQGLLSDHICKMLLEAGIAAGVPLEIDAPHPVTTPTRFPGRPEQKPLSGGANCFVALGL